MLKQIKDCSIEQVNDYVKNKLSEYDIVAVYINEDDSVVAEYWNKRGEKAELELEATKRIRIEG